MKFKQIQAFITVAREGNMTLAAEKMGITQSGLSRLLLSLEADLSASLFERHKHGMALSEYGSAFLPYALTMLNTEQKAREEIELIRGAGKGILRIGCVSSLLTSISSISWRLSISAIPRSICGSSTALTPSCISCC